MNERYNEEFLSLNLELISKTFYSCFDYRIKEITRSKGAARTLASHETKVKQNHKEFFESLEEEFDESEIMVMYNSEKKEEYHNYDFHDFQCVVYDGEKNNFYIYNNDDDCEALFPTKSFSDLKEVLKREFDNTVNFRLYFSQLKVNKTSTYFTFELKVKSESMKLTTLAKFAKKVSQ